MARILLVDDEKQIQKILSLLLQDQGHRVERALSGEEALEKATDFCPDVVLMDLSLPGIDGLEAMSELRQKLPGTDVIIMTAYGSIRSAVDAMRAGAFDYLTKPFDNDEMLLTLERALKMRRIRQEVEELRNELESRYGFNEIIGISPAMQEVFRTMAKVARVDATVLITGESGTGKELVARAIHRRSAHASGPFVAVNCSAIPETLIEAEFFGYEKGAFTDARVARPGKFEQADGGTLFLDEIGDLSLEAQARLLRALQERQVTRLGGQRTLPVQVRVVAATNRNLEQAVARAGFREDLYWRINVVSIQLPPLRRRRPDLPILIDHFLQRYNRELGLSVTSIEPDARRLLIEYDWPGNVRELENTLCRAMVLCEGKSLLVSDLPPRIRGEAEAGEEAAEGRTASKSLSDAVRDVTENLEKRLIVARLAECGGNRTATAESLGISRKTLFNKMKHYHLISGEDLEH